MSSVSPSSCSHAARATPSARIDCQRAPRSFSKPLATNCQSASSPAAKSVTGVGSRSRILCQERVVVVGIKGGVARQQLIQHDAQRPHVHPGIEMGVSSRLLR